MGGGRGKNHPRQPPLTQSEEDQQKNKKKPTCISHTPQKINFQEEEETCVKTEGELIITSEVRTLKTWQLCNNKKKGLNKNREVQKYIIQ